MILKELLMFCAGHSPKSATKVVLREGKTNLCWDYDIDGKTVQQGHTADMLYTADELIAYISRFFTLRTGDLLYTGTPAGVGQVAIDNHLEGWLEDRKVLDFFCK